LNSQCLQDYQELKLKKVSKFVIFGFNDNNTEIVVKPFDNTLPSVPVSDDERTLNPHYAEFRSQLPPDQCRYGVYDLAQEKEGAIRNKLVFFHWAPDNAKIKAKMISSSSKDVIRRALVGIAHEIEAQDPEDLELKNVTFKVFGA